MTTENEKEIQGILSQREYKTSQRNYQTSHQEYQTDMSGPAKQQPENNPAQNIKTQKERVDRLASSMSWWRRTSSLPSSLNKRKYSLLQVSLQNNIQISS